MLNLLSASVLACAILAGGGCAQEQPAERPKIDRIADAGMRFTDHDAQASCTAGRAACITGNGARRGARKR